MSRSPKRQRGVLAFFLILTLFHHSAEARPNIVLLVADDLGYGELGCQGNVDIPTPNIDSIARDGVRFTDGYVTAPFCSANSGSLASRRSARSMTESMSSWRESRWRRPM